MGPVLPPIVNASMGMLVRLLQGQTEDAVRALLSCGLHITDHYKFQDLEDNESSSLWNFWKARLQLLQSRDSLEVVGGKLLDKDIKEEEAWNEEQLRVLYIQTLGIKVLKGTWLHGPQPKEA
ncbi:hypothetical protein Taro_000282 [Colocasia esculenta]|uniref:Uncharacterized protein n=1 Tax=Colocasia esculenta TaxID=4460 RepID=A0A843TCK8_COLES|nr:hypothetical protein [Colocasia esculenta]